MNISNFCVDNNIRVRKKTVCIHLYGRTVGKFMMDRIALFILLVGGLNWGLVGLFQFDVIAWAFGGSASVVSRILYIVVALAAIWCISLFFRQNEVLETNNNHREINN